jgi:hypothetical protein
MENIALMLDKLKHKEVVDQSQVKQKMDITIMALHQ